MSSENMITQIKVGRFTVGIIGLHAALKEAAAADPPSDEAISRFLLDRLREDNYFPPAAEERYARAFLREFRKHVGKPIPEEESGVLEIRILGPGCPNCEKLLALVQQVLVEFDITADLEHIRDVNRITEYGFVATPGLVINGAVKSSGRLPTPKQILQWLQKVS